MSQAHPQAPFLAVRMLQYFDACGWQVLDRPAWPDVVRSWGQQPELRGAEERPAHLTVQLLSAALASPLPGVLPAGMPCGC